MLLQHQIFSKQYQISQYSMTQTERESLRETVLIIVKTCDVGLHSLRHPFNGHIGWLILPFCVALFRKLANNYRIQVP